MADKEIKKAIQEAIQAFAAGDLTQNSSNLFKALGYGSERKVDLPRRSYDEFKRDVLEDVSKFNEDMALVKEWQAVNMLFQLTRDELTIESSLFTDTKVDDKIIESYLFFAIELKKDHYNRTILSQITREVNKAFKMPVMILFKYGGKITIAVINRRLHKKDEQKDVLLKVTVIKDISIERPHRAHVEILFDLSWVQQQAVYKCTNFVELHEAWQRTLDTKELNKRFYRELSSWYFWAVNSVSFPNDVSTTKDDTVFNSENVIRMLTRLIFIWFIKEKNLIPEAIFDEKEVAGLLKGFKGKKSTVYYRAILQNLFFATLNQKREERKFASEKSFLEQKKQYGIKTLFRHAEDFNIAQKDVIKLFDSVPFLNGGLFDCLDTTDKDGKVFYHDGFSRNPKRQAQVPDELFFSEEKIIDLSEVYGDTRKKNEKVKGLFAIFNNYKFTIAENTPIEEEVALDPELLGRVFENLLASYNPETQTTARKATGSFYTPREIVSYMVDESLMAHLKQKLETEAAMSPDDAETGLRFVIGYYETKNPFPPKETSILIDAIDSCKILDPACGSGAFPMGMLHKLVHVLHKLDPKNELWKKRQIKKARAIDDPEIRDNLISDIETAFENNELDYGRKLYLIENCIFGVDIQPIATQISKLRFFISLVVDQTVNREIENFGIRPLPNLETKFVAANTLIGVEKPEIQRGLFENKKLEKLENNLKEVRHRIFGAKTAESKKKLHKEDLELREKIAKELEDEGWSNEAAGQLAGWDPYNQNTSSPFFDPEWMFGIKEGFDIVIGNPPYLKERDNKKYFDPINNSAFGKKYHQGKMDFWFYFLHIAIDLIRKKGFISYITSRYWLNSSGAKKLINRVSKELSFINLVDIGKLKVFDAVAGQHMVAVYQKTNEVTEFTYKKLSNDLADICSPTNTENIIISKRNNKGIYSENDEILLDRSSIVFPNIVPLGTILDITQGVVQNPDKVSAKMSQKFRLQKDAGVFVLTDSEIEQMGTLTTKEQSFVRDFFDENSLGKYSFKSSKRKYILYLTRANCPNIKEHPNLEKHLDRFKKIMQQRRETKKGVVKWFQLHWPREEYYFENRKIVCPCMFIEPSGTIIEKAAYFGISSIVMVQADKNYKLEYVLAILNSKLAKDWYYRNGKKRGAGVDIGVKKFRSFPINKADLDTQLVLSELVNQILETKKNKKTTDTSGLESQIDQLVYQLYGLSEEEIKVIEEKNG